MASTFSDLGIELMATGENAGTWGTKTNTNLQIVEKAIAGYVEKSIAGGAQTTALTITDGDTTESTSVARHAVIKLTGTITGNQVVTVPDSIEKVFIVVNGTSGSFTVQFKTVSGTGVTFGASDKGTRLLFSDGTNIVDTATGGVGSYDLNGDSLILDEDQDTTITADTDDQIDIAIAGADDFRFTANTFTALSGSSVVIPDGGLTLGSTAVSSTAAELNILDGVTSTAAELNILDGVTSTTAELNILDGVTSTAAELNLLDGITAGTVSASLAVIVDSNKDISGFRNLSITGDLTVAGDDITMGTNTAGNLLIADGTNFNSVAVGSLSEISTVANDDVFLAVDTSGGGLKKIARSTIVSGLATSGAISNIVEDTSPQLGANLDTNSHNILIDDAHFIGDENGNEQIIFQTTSSAVNQFDVTNAATGNPPKISATGGDSNIDFDLEAKGTGHVTIRGNSNSGAIQFNCEANSHGQILKAQPHSAGVTNEMLLPAGSSSTLVSLVSTDTLENKTLTTPVIAEIDSGSTITLDATTDIILDADGADIIFKDGGTSIATFTNSSTDFIIESATSDKDIIFKVNDGGSSTEVARFDGDVSALLMASGKKIMLGAAEETISGDGTDITFEVGSSGDINIPANIGLTFGDDGEKIEGDGTDLTITGNNINLTATADVVIPANVGITFGSGEKIEGDSTDLTITSGAKINLTATSDVHIPNNVGIVFGGDSEKIEGDGTDMTISANNLTIDAAADINLDADGADVNIKDGGTTILSFTNSSSDAVVTAGVQDKDIIFKGDDGGSAVTALTLDMSASGSAIFGAAAYNAEVTLTDASTISWDVSTSPVAKVTLGANRTLGAGSNAVAGQFVSLLVIQDGTGSRTLSFNAAYEFASDTAPTLTTTASKGDLFVFRYNGSKFLEVGRNLALTLS